MSRWSLDTHTYVRRSGRWGLSLAPRESVAAARAERRWRWPVLMAQAITIPAFYAEMLRHDAGWLADGAYLVAAAVLLASLVHVSRLTREPARHLRSNPTDLVLVVGLLASVVAPASDGSTGALALRMVVALGSLLRMVWSIQHLITRGGLAYQIGRAHV